MIFNSEELTDLSVKLGIPMDDLKVQVEGITNEISNPNKYNFLKRNITFITSSKNGKLEMVSSMFKVDDTILISKSLYNDGIYVIKDLDGTLNKNLYDCDYNKITLLEYPMNVKNGVIDLLTYKKKTSSKIGIKSESLSRHNVVYDTEKTNLYDFLEPYKRPRF